jgi:hypothetical protein
MVVTTYGRVDRNFCRSILPPFSVLKDGGSIFSRKVGIYLHTTLQRGRPLSANIYALPVAAPIKI